MRKSNVVASMLAIGAMSLSTMAQSGQPKGKDRPQPPAGERPARNGGGEGGQPGGGRGGQMAQLPPEKAKAAQEAEATGVAARNGLNAEQTKALVAAYLDARKSHGEATQKMREEQREKMRDGGGDDRQAAGEAMQKAMAELNKSETAKFEKALGDKIPADKKSAVLGSLGTFTPQWDRWVDALSEFKLDAAKNQSALNAIEDFVVAQGKARGGDREAMRTANQEGRQKLIDTMKKLLSEEQFAKFEASMGGGQRRGGGGGRPGGGAGGGGGGEPK